MERHCYTRKSELEEGEKGRGGGGETEEGDSWHCRRISKGETNNGTEQVAQRSNRMTPRH